MEKIERLTRLNVEIEGLLRVLSNRDNSTAREMLKEKCNEFTALFGELMSEVPEVENKDAATEPAEAFATKNAEAKDVESTEEDGATEPGDETENVKDESVTENTVDEKDIVFSDAPGKGSLDVVDEDYEGHEEPHSFEDVDESIIVPVELGDFPVEDEPVQQPVNEPVAEPVAEHVTAESETLDDTPTEPENATLGERLSEEMPPEIRVDEMIARRTAGDLTKAFTLNDKIRFRRSLFASDADEFARVLSDLSDIDTYKQATTFLTSVLGWDLNNPEVEEFLTIIRPHYPKAD